MICEFCLKIALISLFILIVLLSTLSYVGVYTIYIGVPLIVICGFISFSKFCKDKMKGIL
jgi:hypothetical protein